METKKNRKEIRKELISPFILHSKEFGQKGLKEEKMDDGSIKFYFEGFASTIEKDGHGEIVEPKGIKLERYLKNPIIKKGHLRGGENNIGLVTEINIKRNGMYIYGYAILNPEIENHKKIIHGLRHSLIKGFSIGFGDVVMEWNKEKNANIIKSLELYEISLVDIPSNPLTLTKAIELYIQKQEEKEIQQVEGVKLTKEEDEEVVDEEIKEEEKENELDEKIEQEEQVNQDNKEEEKEIEVEVEEEIEIEEDENDEEEEIEEENQDNEDTDNKSLDATNDIGNDIKSENDINEQTKQLQKELDAIKVSNVCYEELLQEYSKTVELLTKQLEEKNAIIEKARKTIIEKQGKVFQKENEEQKPYLFEELKSIQEKYRI